MMTDPGARTTRRPTAALAFIVVLLLSAAWAGGRPYVARAAEELPDIDRPAALFMGIISTGEGKARGGAWLDSTGGLLAVDELETTALAVCPGDRLAVQVGTMPDTVGQQALVRDLATLEVIERFGLPPGVTARAVTCRDENAADVLIVGEAGIHDARSGERLVDVTFARDRPVFLSRRSAVGLTYDEDSVDPVLVAVDLGTRTVVPLLRRDVDYALDPGGERVAVLEPAFPRLTVIRLGPSEGADGSPEMVEEGRRRLPKSTFDIVGPGDEAFDAPLYLRWADDDRIVYVRGQQPNVARNGLGRVSVIDASDLSLLCRWRGWNVEPIASADGVLLGAGGPFRSRRSRPEGYDPSVVVNETMVRRKGRTLERWRIAGGIAARDAAGAPGTTFGVPDAEPTGLVVPLPGFDAEVIPGGRSASCLGSPDTAPTVGPDGGSPSDRADPAVDPDRTEQASQRDLEDARPAIARRGRWWVEGEYRVSRRATRPATRSREPIVAAHPFVRRRLAVVFPMGAGIGRPTIRISHDGGRTWRTTPGHPSAGGNHPVLAWGPGPRRGRARLYYGGMGGSGSRYHPTISWSDDEGRTWSKPHVARATRGWSGAYPDMVVDNDPASPNYGVLYYVYNWPKSPATGPGVRVLASGDYGRTFAQIEIPKLRAPRGYPDAWRISQRLATAPDGSAYVSGYQLDLRTWNPDDLFAKGDSTNVGRIAFGVVRLRYDRKRDRLTRSRNVLVTRLPKTAWNLGRAPAGLSGPMIEPHWDVGLAVDRGGRIYFAVATGGRIRISTSDDKGRTWRTRRLPKAPRIRGRRQLAVRPDLIAGEGFVAVLFHTVDAQSAGRTAGSVAAVSFDRGASWKGPRAIGDVRWATAPVAALHNGAGLRDRATLLADGRTLYFAYGDGRDRPSAIFGARLRVRPPDGPGPVG